MVRFAWAGVLLLVLAGPASAKPIRIMAIGDSLVQGGRLGTDEFTFRYPLYLGLRKAGYEVDMVGARHEGLKPDYRWPRDFDTDHEGFYGQTTAEIEAHLEADLPMVDAPDWAIFLVGENDDKQDPDHTTIPALGRMIGLLRAKNPEVRLLLIQVPGYWREMPLHAAVDRLARQLHSAASPVLTLPLFEHWNKDTDTYDGDHPNPVGQAKIARLALDLLLPLLP